MTLLPPDDDLELIHTRRYETRVYWISDEELLVRGAISDTKPPRLYVVDDPDTLEIHRMGVELRVRLPDLEITAVDVLFETHPNQTCPLVVPRYQALVGLCIARGFTGEVRKLFGGPRGCTHTNALLQAMAPAAVQALWSVSVRRDRAAGRSHDSDNASEGEQRMAANLDTCHVWDRRGEHVAALRRGDRAGSTPLPIQQRLRALGRPPEEWP